MSVWSTKSFDRDRKYIILKHTIPGVNNVINGVKFRGGYAVVEQGSKTYYQLKQIPFLQKASELPLIYLGKLKFITRPLDIKTVYGQEVYASYLAELEVSKKDAEIKSTVVTPIEPLQTCSFITRRGTPCKYSAMPESPNKYCTLHILKDPGLASLGIEIPASIETNKREKEVFIDKVIKGLRNGKISKSILKVPEIKEIEKATDVIETENG